MLSRKEHSFLRYWEEQRDGGRWSYLLLYTGVGTFMFSLIFSIALLLFYNVYYRSPFFWIVPLTAFITSGLYAYTSWKLNENKWRNIIKREVDQGKASDKN
ncbi:MAG TPA: hypothetical protein VM012_12795 [Flavitalea sp.]|nr:hypothetical protein [Flavitalea sp.]